MRPYPLARWYAFASLFTVILIPGCGMKKDPPADSPEPSKPVRTEEVRVVKEEPSGDPVSQPVSAGKEPQKQTAIKAEKADLSEVKSDRQASVMVGEGAGTSRDEALRDAFRSAVRQAVGAYVDEETRVKDDQLIKDEVLTYSDGIITRYQELQAKLDSGLWRVRIKAQVERRGLVERLKAANVTVKDVDGAGLFAGIVTDLEASKNARAALDKVLGKFPLDCLTATLEGEPMVLKKENSRAIIRLKVALEPDRKAYQETSARLVKLLEVIKKKKGEFSLKAQKVTLSRDFAGPFTKSFEVGNRRSLEDGLKGMGQLVLAVCTHHSRDFDNSSWRWYVLDETAKYPLAGRAAYFFTIKLTLVDRDGKTVAVDCGPAVFDVRGQVAGYPSLIWPDAKTLYNLYQPKVGFAANEYKSFIHPEKYGRGKVYFLGPLFFRGNIVAHHFAQRLTIERDMILSLKEIKAIHKVKVELTHEGDFPPNTEELDKQKD